MRPHRGSVKSRFVPPPSKASLSIYTKGLDQRLKKLWPLRARAREDGTAEAQSALQQEDVSRAKLLLKRTVLLGNTSTEETWLLLYITLYSTKHNGGLYLVYGLYQNSTNNKMWISPLGKSGDERSLALVSSQPAEYYLQWLRVGIKGKVIEVTQTSVLKGISTPHKFQRVLYHPRNVWLIRASLRDTSDADDYFGISN